MGTYRGRRMASSARGSLLMEKTPMAPTLDGRCWPVALAGILGPGHLDA